MILDTLYAHAIKIQKLKWYLDKLNKHSWTVDNQLKLEFVSCYDCVHVLININK